MTENVDRGVCGGDGEFSEFGEFFSADKQQTDGASGLKCSLTVLQNERGYATKVFSLDEAGKLQKQSAASIYDGHIATAAVQDIRELMTLLAGLKPHNALTFGVTAYQKARLLTKDMLEGGSFPGTVARDRAHFSFRDGQAGILMLDYDPREGQPALDWQEIDRIIGEIIPSWAETQRLWKVSSSAFLYTKDGLELIGKGGWRGYVMVDNAAAIPGVGAFLYQALWKKGHGYIKISKSGQALDRSLVDAAVWQPEVS